MTDSDDDELQALRARAYGPGGDLDAEAVQRLRELEQARKPVSVAADVPVDAETETPPMAEETRPDTEPLGRPREPLLGMLFRRARTLRRSTVITLLAIVAFAVASVVVLTVVQRVQTDPLQAGAEQVARLGLDPSFRVPLVFRGGPNGEVTAVGFQVFHGVRPVVTEGGFFGSGAEEPCLSVYPDDVIEDPESGSFSGPLIGGCAVKGFPAIAQFSSDLEGFPEELLEEFPDSGLQFVYDSANNEVVVFAS